MIVKVLVAGLCATLARSLRARQRLLMLTFLASNPSRCRRRPIFAARAAGSGRVRAAVTIGADGQVSKLDLDGGDASLQADVGAALAVPGSTRAALVGR